MKIARPIFILLRDTIQGFTEAKGTLLAAALAYYTIFSLAPLLYVAVSVAGVVFGEAAATGLLIEQISNLVGPEVAQTISRFLENIRSDPSIDLTTIVSIVIILVGASIMFVQLKRALNFIWGIEPQPGKGLILIVKTHLLSFTLVVGAGLLLLASMVFNTVLSLLSQAISFLPNGFSEILPQYNFGVNWAVFTLIFAIIYKLLPDARIAWRDVLMGAAFTSLLFTLGEFLIGFYLRRVNLGSAFGSASSIILVLVWIYYSMQIILFGAKFTQVFSNQFGQGVLPARRADLIVTKRVDNGEFEI